MRMGRNFKSGYESGYKKIIHNVAPKSRSEREVVVHHLAKVL